MQLEKLTLEGFRAFKEHEEILLNNSPLTLIDGPNGEGKSTIFEAIIFALFAKYRTSTINGVISRGKKKTRVELIFTVENTRYKVVREKTRREHEAYLYVADPAAEGGWQVLSEKNPTTSTDPLIVEVLGMDYQTSLATWVMDQDSTGDICTQAPAERRKRLQTIFGLDDYKTREQKAKGSRDAAEKHLKKEAGTLEALQERLEEIEQSTGVDGLGELTDLQLSRRLENYDARNEEITSSLAVNLGDKASLQNAIEEARHAITAFHKAHEQQVQVHREQVHFKLSTYQQAQDSLGPLERTVLQAKNAITAAQNGEMNARRYVEEARKRVAESADAGWAISGLNSEIQSLETQLASIENTASDYETNLIPDLEARKNSYSQSIAAFIANQKSIETSGAEIRERQKSLQLKAGECFTCGQSLDDAHRQQIHKDYEDQATELKVQWHNISAQIKEAKEKEAEAQQQIVQAQGKLRELRAQGQNVSNELAGKRQSVVSAQAVADDYQNRVEAQAAAEQGVTEAAEQVVSAQEQLRVAQEELTAKHSEIEPLKAAYDEAAAAPEPVEDVEALGKLNEALRVAETNLENSANAEETRAKLRSERDEIRAHQLSIWSEQERRIKRKSDLKEQQAKIDKCQKKIAEIQKEYDHYAHLAQAYSPTGIPSMILAGLIDSLNEYTNMALESLGMDYGVEITTQKENSSGKVSDEKVMIYVTTPEGTDEYLSLSGSERLRVRIAVREGLMMCMETQTGKPVRTFLWDEIWSSLDEDKKEMMVGEAVRLAEDYQVFTISHEPSVKASIPYVISVDGSSGTARTSQYVR